MKKLASVILIAVFALSFVSGMIVSKAEAKPLPDPCYQAGECDYTAQKVYVCCLLSSGVKCFWSHKYFYDFCDSQ